MGLQGLRLPARANTRRPFYHRSNSNEENLYYYSFENSIIVSNAHTSLWKYRSRYYNDLSLNFHAVTGSHPKWHFVSKTFRQNSSFTFLKSCLSAPRQIFSFGVYDVAVTGTKRGFPSCTKISSSSLIIARHRE
jgi:hypothetical protein